MQPVPLIVNDENQDYKLNVTSKGHFKKQNSYFHFFLSSTLLHKTHLRRLFPVSVVYPVGAAVTVRPPYSFTLSVDKDLSLDERRSDSGLLLPAGCTVLVLAAAKQGGEEDWSKQWTAQDQEYILTVGSPLTDLTDCLGVRRRGVSECAVCRTSSASFLVVRSSVLSLPVCFNLFVCRPVSPPAGVLFFSFPVYSFFIRNMYILCMRIAC